MTWFFVDSITGNDSNTGHAAAAPWKTIGRVNVETYAANDVVWFRSGSEWRGETLVVPRANMIYRAWYDWTGNDGVQPILSGGDLVSGFTLSTGTIYYATLASLDGVPPIVSWTVPPVYSIDPTSGLPVVTASVSTGLVAGGSAATLTSMQYYYDSGASRLYVNVGGNPDGPTLVGQVEVSVRKIVTGSFATTTFRDFDFRHSIDGAVTLDTAASGHSITGCWFRHHTRTSMGAGGLEGCIRIVNGGTAGTGVAIRSCQWQNCANTGVYIKNTRTVEVQACTMLVAIGTVVGDQGSHGIRIDQTAAGDSQNSKIHENYIVFPAGHTGGGVTVETDPTAIGLAGGLVHSNTLVGGMFGVRSRTNNITIRNNTLRTQNSSGAAGILVDDAFDWAGLVITYNLIYNGQTAIKFDTETNFRQATIAQNTCINQTFSHLWLDTPVWGFIENNLLWNYNAHVTDHIIYLSSVYTGGGHTLVCNYNMLASAYANCLRLGVTEYATRAAWTTGTTFDANSLQGQDPLLAGGSGVGSLGPDANPYAYYLTALSPAIDAGTAISGISQIIVGGAADLGAYEFVAAPALPSAFSIIGGGGPHTLNTDPFPHAGVR